MENKKKRINFKIDLDAIKHQTINSTKSLKATLPSIPESSPLLIKISQTNENIKIKRQTTSNNNNSNITKLNIGNISVTPRESKSTTNLVKIERRQSNKPTIIRRNSELKKNKTSEFNFNIDLYRRRFSQQTPDLLSSRLKQIFEDRRSSCKTQIKRRSSNLTNKVSRMRCYIILEKMVENCVTQLKRQELLEGSTPFSDKVIKELLKEQKDKDSEKITTLLENLPGFKKFMNIMGLSRKILLKAAEKLSYMKVRPGEYIFREGNKSDNFYCILSGKIELSKVKRIERDLTSLISSHPNYKNIADALLRRSNTKLIDIQELDIPFTTLKDGEVFGEYGLIDDKDRGANAKALIETDLLVVDYPCFKNYFKSSIERVLVERKLYVINRIPYFSNFTKEEFHKIFLKMIIKPHEKGKIIIEEGSKAENLFLILKGGVCKLSKKFKSGQIHIITMLEGDMFGLEAASENNYNELLDKKELSRPIIEDNLTEYNYTVSSDSNDTIILQLNLLTSEIYKKELFVQLQHMHKNKSQVINEIFEKQTLHRLNYKPTYKKDVFERRVDKVLLSSYLDKSGKTIDKIRSNAIKEYKSNQYHQISLKLTYIDSKMKQFNTIDTETILPSTAISSKRKTNNYYTDQFALLSTDRVNNKFISTNSDLSELLPKRYSKVKFDSIVDSKSNNENSLYTSDLKLTKNISKFSLKNQAEMTEFSKSRKPPIFDEYMSKITRIKGSNFNIVKNKSNRKILMLKTENFNLQLVSQLSKMKS